MALRVLSGLRLGESDTITLELLAHSTNHMSQMFPHDRIFCSLGYRMQDADSRGSHALGNCPHKIWQCSTHRLDRTLSHQQHHCRGKYAARCKCSHLSSVS